MPRKLLNIHCSNALGLELSGLVVGNPFGLLVWTPPQLQDGWRTFSADKWQRKLQWKTWQLSFKFVGLSGKLETLMFSRVRPLALEKRLRLLLLALGITSMQFLELLDPILPNLPGSIVRSPSSLLEFNIDGAYKSTSSAAAFGVIARDCGGSAQLWRTGKVVVASALVIEAWALRIACGIARDMGLSEAIFESDYLELIYCFDIPSATRPWEIWAIVEDIDDWGKNRNWLYSA
ncbi:hypothetical protein RHMOL_Rhmol12G0060100 [Rhododendron molle]|uniref:Uncharacterized protein n=1 Tax=Rhododendron molle TaxID=49168 RepID=A0ACC0LFS1_RHOML|nr:hypothetical protein RHMOL_Rhmol12G0060100 [Rhododendron molle]